MLSYVLEYEGFYDKQQKKFIIQEYASVDQNISFHHFFLLLPNNYDHQQFNFVCKNINHIPDFIGTEKFSNFTSFLGQECQFYAKGKVKCKYFSQFTKHPVINIEDYKCPKLNTLDAPVLTNQCSLLSHHTILNCALSKAIKLTNWMKLNYFLL